MRKIFRDRQVSWSIIELTDNPKTLTMKALAFPARELEISIKLSSWINSVKLIRDKEMSRAIIKRVTSSQFLQQNRCISRNVKLTVIFSKSWSSLELILSLRNSREKKRLILLFPFDCEAESTNTVAISREVTWMLNVPDVSAVHRHTHNWHNRQFLECERRVRQYALSANTMGVHRTICWISASCDIAGPPTLSRALSHAAAWNATDEDGYGHVNTRFHQSQKDNVS